MKNYTILPLTILSLILGGSITSFPAFAEEGSTNLPGSSTNPLNEHTDPNKAIEKEKSGHLIPDKIEPPLECEEANTDDLNSTKNLQKKCKKKNPNTKSPNHNNHNKE